MPEPRARLRTGATVEWLSGLVDPDRVALGLRLCRVLDGAERAGRAGALRRARPVPPTAAKGVVRDPYGVLRASREDLLGLSGRLRDAAFRQRTACPELSMLLTSIAFERLRRYDLVLACVLLRGAAAVAPPRARDLQEAVRVLVRQQRPDGAFGFFARPGPAEDPQAALALYLPVTLHCLWSIAELTRPSFRIAARIPAASKPPGSGFSAALDAWIGV